MRELQVFNFEARALRTHKDENGNPWFVAKDVCDVLAITRHRDAISSMPDKYKRRVKVDGHLMVFVNEPGFYKFVIKSNKPNAERFQDWVFEEVLPKIRKTGSYGIDSGWKEARLEGKSVRKISTDIMQKFVEYATEQGSSSAKFYYVNFSKIVNSSLLEVVGEKPKDLRNNLNIFQLQAVAVAETIIAKTLVDCMNKDLPYKEVYQIVKSKVEEFGGVVGRSKIGQTERQLLGVTA